MPSEARTGLQIDLHGNGTVDAAVRGIGVHVDVNNLPPVHSASMVGRLRMDYLLFSLPK